MHNRFKKLLKALLDADVSTVKAEADKAQRSIDNDRQPLEDKLALLNEEQAYLNMTLKLHLPDVSTAISSKPAVYKSPHEKGADGYSKKERGKFIRDTALALVAKGQLEVASDEVLADLSGRGITFTIKRPQAAVGSTLSAMKEFRRTEEGKYRYIGTEIQTEVLPLMESVEAH